MKCYISVVCVLSALLAVTLAAPSTFEIYELSPSHHQVKRQATNGQQETINRVIDFSNQKIQLLRRLCPQLFQVIDNVIQNVTSQVFRVVGGALLRSGGLGGGGGGGGGGGSSSGNRVSVVLPTFPPDEDEDDESEEAKTDIDIRTGNGGPTSPSSEATTVTMTPIALSVDIAANEVNTNSGTSSSTGPSVTEASSVVTSPSSSEGPMPFTSPSLTSDNSLSKRHVRIARSANDQEASASGDNGPDPAEDLANIADDADRNKRLVPFGVNAQVSAGGGSGNFLFDLIRLVSGSGTTEESDEKEAGAGGVAEVDVQAKSGEGIPGPITRLLVIANRGLANLIQDLILRLAQTSERIVNFKARLVTALI